MKKLILTTAALFLIGAMAGLSRAQEIVPVYTPVPAVNSSLFNFGDFFHSLRAGYGIDQHGQKADIYYTAFQRYHNKSGVDFLTLNIGYNGVEKHPMFMTGIRLDNIVPLIWGGTWGKAHVTTASLPTFEFGPFISVWPKSMDNVWRLDMKYGVGLAIGFPGL